MERQSAARQYQVVSVCKISELMRQLFCGVEWEKLFLSQFTASCRRSLSDEESKKIRSGNNQPTFTVKCDVTTACHVNAQ